MNAWAWLWNRGARCAMGLSALALAACGGGGGGDGVDAGPLPDGSLANVEQHFVTDALDGCNYASPIEVTSQGERFILTIAQKGTMAFVDPDSGEIAWRYEITSPELTGDERPEVLSTPVVVDERWLVLGWQDIAPDFVKRRHWVAVFDLETREMAEDFELLKLEGSVPTYAGDGTVELESQWQLMRSTIHHVHTDDTEMGLAYVSLGNGPSEQPFHGWVFELDLDAWRDGTADDAIANLMVTTAENDCGGPGSRNPSLCGGGVWTPAGLQIYEESDGSYRLLVPTGNGRVDFDRGAYAHSLLRVGRGLDFMRGCDDSLCEPFDELEPSRECLASCENIFVPRLEPDDPPIRPEEGVCDGMTFLECYGRLDADLGANAPVVVDVPDGPRVVVQPGKDGALYLVDLDHMGTMYQRMQVMDFCGTPDDPCKAHWIGTFVTHPATTMVDGDPMVVLASQMSDRTHPSGVTAVRVVMREGEPRMEIAWQVPDFESEEATKMFRHHPGRPVIHDVGGEPHVFVLETRRASGGEFTSPPGVLWGIRMRDGFPTVQQPVTDAGHRYVVPLVTDDTLYLNTCNARADDKGRLEAFRIGMR